MMSEISIAQQLKDLNRLARRQSGFRLTLRALWLGIAGYLLGWGLNALWGWLPHPFTWFFLGGILALAPLIGLWASRKSHRDWVWWMDRRLGLEEQASTALAAIQAGKKDLVSAALLQDLDRLLPAVHQRIRKRGWFLRRDLLSLSIVALLGLLVLVSTWAQPIPVDLLDPLAAGAPFIPKEPSAAEVLQQEEQDRQAAPGLAPNEAGPVNPSQALPKTGGDGSENGAAAGDSGAMAEALEKMGDQLSQQAPTFELGQALKQQDLKQAAGELESLADQMEGLSPETKQNLAEAMQDASDALDQAQQAPRLSEDLDQSAEALTQSQSGESENDRRAAQAVDQLARDFQELAGQSQGEQATGSGEPGDSSTHQAGVPESPSRLQGQGEDFDLPVEGSAEADLLSPAPPGSAASGQASGSLDAGAPPGEEVIPGSLVPNTYSWKWRDVVSSYFTR